VGGRFFISDGPFAPRVTLRLLLLLLLLVAVRSPWPHARVEEGAQASDGRRVRKVRNSPKGRASKARRRRRPPWRRTRKARGDRSRRRRRWERASGGEGGGRGGAADGLQTALPPTPPAVTPFRHLTMATAPSGVRAQSLLPRDDVRRRILSGAPWPKGRTPPSLALLSLSDSPFPLPLFHRK